MTNTTLAGSWLGKSAGLVASALLALACSASSDEAMFPERDDGTGAIPGGGGGGGSPFGGTGSGGTGGQPGGGWSGDGITLSGRVLAPSGDFPIAGALVYLTQTEPEPIPSAVYKYKCDQMGGIPYALSAADGTWTIENAPKGAWKLVTRKGNFRRVRDVELSVGMTPDVDETLTTLPGARSADGRDTIPTYAVVKTSPDLTYNLLGKFGLGKVNGSGELQESSAQFALFEDDWRSSHPRTTELFSAQGTLNGYQMIFLPCNSSDVGEAFVKQKLNMLRNYVAAGGKIYNSCTVSLWTEAPFPEYIDFYGNDAPTTWDIGRRTQTDYSTSGKVLDSGLADWMRVVTGDNPDAVPFHKGYVTIEGTKDVADGHGLDKDGGVVKPYTWVTDVDSYAGSPLMVTYNYDAGKVFYSVYETSTNSTRLTPQEYVLLYVILEVGVCDNPPPPPVPR